MHQNYYFIFKKSLITSRNLRINRKAFLVTSSKTKLWISTHIIYNVLDSVTYSLASMTRMYVIERHDSLWSVEFWSLFAVPHNHLFIYIWVDIYVCLYCCILNRHIAWHIVKYILNGKEGYRETSCSIPNFLITYNDFPTDCSIMYVQYIICQKSMKRSKFVEALGYS